MYYKSLNFSLTFFLLSYWLTVAFCVRYIQISFFKCICDCIQKDYQMVYIIMSLVQRAQITNYILTIVLIEKSMIKLNKFW